METPLRRLAPAATEQPGNPQREQPIGGARSGGRLLPRVRGRKRRLPHRQRDLPDRDQGAGDRLLLRGRHRCGRHRRTGAVRPARGYRGSQHVRHRIHGQRGGHGLGRHRRAHPRRPRGRTTHHRTQVPQASLQASQSETFPPGPGSLLSGRSGGTDPRTVEGAEQALEREIDTIAQRSRSTDRPTGAT